VEGWLDYAQSFAIISGYHLLDLASRSGLELRFRELPPPPAEAIRRKQVWQRTAIWNDQQIQRLSKIRRAGADDRADAVLRISFPGDFSPSNNGRTFVFAATENGQLTTHLTSPGQLNLMREGIDIITPSRWSHDGLIRSGANPEQIHIVPHGVDTEVFHPLDKESREQLRRQLGWHDRFVMLNVSAQYRWKGIRLLLQSFATMVDVKRDLLLVLKGSDEIYNSGLAMQIHLQNMHPRLRQNLKQNVAYTGSSLSVTQLVEYYQAADVLVAPYHAEGFNLPALEALACGLPVICTGGGPTDEFVDEKVGYRTPSKTGPGIHEGDIWLYPDPDSFLAQMHAVYDDNAFRNTVRSAGPERVRQGWTWSQATDRLLDVLFHDESPG